MTDLYTEAVKDAEKLREIAEQDAKNRLIEQLAPYIKKVIAKEVAGSSDFFFEQDDDVDQDPLADPQGMGGAQPTTMPPTTTDTTQTLAPQLGNQATQTPMAPVASPEGEDLVGASMPDEEGKIVVDFSDLFVDAETDQVTITPGAAPVQAMGGEQPVPAPETASVPAPEAPPAEHDDASLELAGEDLLSTEEESLPLPTEGISYKEYNRVLSNISERIDRAFFAQRISDISRTALKTRLFDLMEALDEMRNRGLITNKQARLNENKLEFLFLKLKEAGFDNSYFKKEQQGKGTDMTSLKEFAAKLFEEDENLAKDSASTGETGLNVDDEYSKHAANVSGVDPKLGGPKDIKVAQEGKELAEETKGGTAGSVNAKSISGKVTADHPWDEGEPVVGEENQDKTVTRSMNENSADANTDANEDVAKGAAGFGDTNEEPVAEFEVDDAELAEAVRSIRKENIKRKLEALREASDGKDEESWEDAEPEGGKDESQKNLKEGVDEMMYEDDLEGLEDDGMGGMDDDLGIEDEGNLVLSIDLPPEVEEELAALGVDDLDVDVSLNVGGEDLDDLDDDDEIEVVDDEGDFEDMESGSAEEDMVLADDTDEVEMDMDDMGDEEVKMESRKVRYLSKKSKLLERKLLKAAKLIEAKNKELESLNKQLAETNLFTSKAVYYSKFLQRALSEKALTKKALQQIVEHLDKGATVAETKAIYTKIRRKLDEHASASRKLGGSSSKVTKPGSANLTEAAQPQAGQESVGQTPNRWQVLAGIKKSE